MQDESQKFRKKMYKSGKFWVAAGALFVGLAFAGNTQADTVLPISRDWLRGMQAMTASDRATLTRVVGQVFHARRKDQSIEENSFFILTTLTKSY